MVESEVRECSTHGMTEHGYYKSGNSRRWRCKACNVAAVQARRVAVKEKAIAYKGGRCERCGYDKCQQALQFHHRDPNVKSFGVAANGHSRSWKRVKEEIDKCDLLCANCHAEIHYADR